jgi:chemotaxis protein CheD
MIDIFLRPGEYFVGDANYRIRTWLGSCVSITLWHPARRIGAMSHFLLACHEGGQSSGLDGRYGVDAMLLMTDELARMDIDPAQCHAKIFGGGDMFPQYARKNGQNVGRKNGEAARGLLQTHGIQLVSESLFGIGHREIFFNIEDGDVWARQLTPVDVSLAPVSRS